MRPIVLEAAGAQLFCIPTDRFKSEYFSVYFTLPVSESTSQATTLLMGVLTRGTQRFPTKIAINRHLDELYSTTVSAKNSKRGDMQRVGFSADFLGARYVGGGNGVLPEVIATVAQLMLEPYMENGTFKGSYVDVERNILRDDIRARINVPGSYAAMKCRQLLCAGEPFALSLEGEENTLDTIAADLLYARHQAIVKENAPVFFYVGATPPEEVAAMISAYFPTFLGKRPVYSSVVKPMEGEARCGEEEMPICQGKLCIGFRSDISHDHPLAPAMKVLNKIYGGSPASKLFLNVREQRSLCYHCSSSLDLHKGVIFAKAGMKTANRAVTEEAMLAEFAAIAAGHITDTELEAAQRTLEYAYRQVYDSPGGLASLYSGLALRGGNETAETLSAAVSRVTKADVVEAAAHVCKGATFFLKGTRQQEED